MIVFKKVKYKNFLSIIKYSGAKAVPLQLYEKDNFEINIEQLKSIDNLDIYLDLYTYAFENNDFKFSNQILQKTMLFLCNNILIILIILINKVLITLTTSIVKNKCNKK